MLGDGVAVDPTDSILRAPCSGTITQLHKASHALTITTDDGLEILLHLGLDTVLLKGQGFSPLVREGDKVESGAPLIQFDISFLVHNAASLLTLIVINSGGVIVSPPPATGIVEGGKTPLFTIELNTAAADGKPAELPSTQNTGIVSHPITIANAAGIHARPAAVIANTANQFAADISLVKDGKTANAKSVVSILKLEIGKNDAITVRAEGADADNAVSRLVPLIESGLGEDIQENAPPSTAPLPPARPASSDPNLFTGVSASSGTVVGEIFQLRHGAIDVKKEGNGIEEERIHFFEAFTEAKQQLTTLQEDLRKRNDTEKAAIFAAHQELLEDPELIDASQKRISQGESAAYAWQNTVTEQAETLSNLNNELLAARANDIRDVGLRVLLLLTGSENTSPKIPRNVILVAENLTPSDTVGLEKTKVLGFVTTGGSATSHASILARAASMPAVAAVDDRAL